MAGALCMVGEGIFKSEKQIKFKVGNCYTMGEYGVKAKDGINK